jgi:FlaG/FlaF family flagellin (archaellin)
MGLNKRKNLIYNNSGFSAVIALVLIVAITVALVALAYTWSSGFVPTGSTASKQMEAVYDNTIETDKLVFSVASADAGIFWDSINVTATKATTGIVTYVTDNVTHSPSSETEVKVGQTFSIDCPDSYSGVYSFKIKFEGNLIWISNDISLT